MDQLRLILLGAGVVVIAFIYLWGMRKQIRARLEERRRRRAALRADNQPTVYFDESGQYPESESELALESIPANRGHNDDIDDYDGEHDQNDTTDPTPSPTAYARPTAQTEQQEATPAATVEPTPMTVLLMIIAPSERPFTGIDILQAAHATDLKLNKNGTLDFLSETEQGRELVFRVGQLKEPGNFDLGQIKDLNTPGLLLFLELPGPLPASKAVDRMTAVAANLAKQLGGTVCDERRNKLSTETLTALRERALEFERRL